MIEIDVHGERYKSLKQLSKETGLNYSRLYYRFHQITTIDKVVSKESWKRNGAKIIYKGKVYRSLQEVVDLFAKVPYGTVQNRLKRGWSVERSIDEVAHNTKRKD